MIQTLGTPILGIRVEIPIAVLVTTGVIAVINPSPNKSLQPTATARFAGAGRG